MVCVSSGVGSTGLLTLEVDFCYFLFLFLFMEFDFWLGGLWEGAVVVYLS